MSLALHIAKNAILGVGEVVDRGYHPVATRCGVNCTRAGGTGPDQQMVCRGKHYLPYGAIDVAPVYGAIVTYPGEFDFDLANWHVGVEPVWGHQVDYGATRIRKIAAGGSVNLTTAAGGLLRCDPVWVNKQAGEAIGTRVWTTTAGGGVPVGRGNPFWGEGEWGITTTGLVWEMAWGGTFPSEDTGNKGFHQPVAILGRLPPGQKPLSLAIVSHSIGYGNVGPGIFDPCDAWGNSGWVERSLGISRPYSNLSSPGDRLQYWMDPASAGGGRRWSRQMVIGLHSHVLLEMAVNDISAGVPLPTYIEWWKQIVAEWQRMGKKVIAATPMPQSGSPTNDWSSFGSQLGGSLELVQWSEWLRTNAATYGCQLVDINAALADQIDPTRWRTDLVGAWGEPPTIDGTHPTTAVNAWLAGQQLLNPNIHIV